MAPNADVVRIVTSKLVLDYKDLNASVEACKYIENVINDKESPVALSEKYDMFKSVKEYYLPSIFFTYYTLFQKYLDGTEVVHDSDRGVTNLEIIQDEIFKELSSNGTFKNINKLKEDAERIYALFNIKD